MRSVNGTLGMSVGCQTLRCIRVLSVSKGLGVSLVSEGFQVTSGVLELPEDCLLCPKVV